MMKLSHDVVDALKGKTLVTAESCTGGQIATRFTDLPGASAFFKGGMVTYTNEAKAKLYARVQSLMKAFSHEKGTYLCRELLATAGPEQPIPANLVGDDGRPAPASIAFTPSAMGLVMAGEMVRRIAVYRSVAR